MIKACIFDMDGTVLDTIGTITYFVNVTLEKFGIRKISEDECKIFVGNGARLLIERTLKSRGLEDEKLICEVLDSYNAAYDADPNYMTKPFDKITELLAALRAHGIKVGIVSNKPDDAVAILSEEYFGELVDMSVGDRPDIRKKPAPDPLLYAAKALGSDRFVFVGDSETDIMAAKNAGVPCISVTWGFRDREQIEAVGGEIFCRDAGELEGEIMRLLEAGE